MLVSPLLTPIALRWELPAEPARFDVVAFTSARAVRLAGPQLEALLALPAVAVGPETLAVAQSAGFRSVEAPPPDRGADADALSRMLADRPGRPRVLHLCGLEHRPLGGGAGFALTSLPVYEARLAERFDPEAGAALAAGRIDWTLLYSARTAAHFARLCDGGGVERKGAALACLAPRVAAAAGSGWKRVVVAAQPRERALFAAANL